MSIKYVVGSGCSFTRGSIDHENPRRLTYRKEAESYSNYSYVRLVGEKLNVPYWNYALGGVGNNYSIRSLYRHVEDNPNTVKDTLFILGLSYNNRYDFIHPNEKSDPLQHEGLNVHKVDPSKKMNIPKAWSMKNSDYRKIVSKMLGSSEEEAENLGKLFYNYIHTPSTFETESLMKVDFIKNYFENKGLKLIIANLIENTYYVPDSFVWPSNYPSWRLYIESYDSNYAGEHPNSYDHEHFADLICESL